MRQIYPDYLTDRITRLRALKFPLDIREETKVVRG